MQRKGILIGEYRDRMIDFSIIIPAYNLELYIEKTLESICRNNLDNIEIVVIDDGSRDDTRRLTEQFLSEKEVPYYMVLSQENSGVSSARNTGIKHANGGYLIFCDGDDLCANNMIETIGDIKDLGYDMIAWRYDTLQDERRTVSQNEFQNTVLENQIALKSFLLSENRIRLGSFAVKKSLIENSNILFTENCAIGEDVEFIYKCLSMAKDVYMLNDVLFTYVKRKGSAMNTFDIRRFQAPIAIRRVYQFVKDNSKVLWDSELAEYMQNGLFIQHCIFSFDACIRYLNNWKSLREFNRVYFINFIEIERDIVSAVGQMKTMPPNISRKKIKLFCLSRKLFVYIYGIKGFLKEGL